MYVIKSKFLLLNLFLLSFLSLQAQDVKVTGGFVEDSISIGQHVNYWIKAVYPMELEVMFPDTSFDFSPYEFVKNTYFETRIKSGLAYDSAVYTLQSFEIDSIQSLSLPVVILDENDSSVIASPTDGLYFMDLAPVVTDTTSLKTNLDYRQVWRQFNYPLLYYILGGLLLIAIILLLIFGKRILRFFRLRKLRKDYERFYEELTRGIRELKAEPTAINAEKLLVLWKKYQQKLERIPFSVASTKEILELEFTQALEKPLQSIDGLIYGNRVHAHIYQDFQQIEDFAYLRYTHKVRAIKHGK